MHSARFERPLTYAVPAELDLEIGEVVRIPLGPRELYGYVISDVRDEAEPSPGLRALAGRAGAERAFDADGLALAAWIAERYCCSLRDALGCVIHGAAIPRVIERLHVVGPMADPARFPSVPPRLIRLLWSDFAAGFTLDSVLRNPEARRAGDRPTLRRAMAALLRAGVLRRERVLSGAPMHEIEQRFLRATGVAVRGPRIRALIDLVASDGTARRSDARLAGFSNAIIARAIQEGALIESAVRSPRQRRGSSALQSPKLVPTVPQRGAIDAIVNRLEDRTFAEFLLEGVTGSGKTLVYLDVIARVLTGGGRAIVLVPEIALTPQTARRFEAAFGDRVAVLHSALSERERFESRLAAARGEIDVVVGARSAVFAALPNLRLIVVDEAHERTYKQETAPRYHATDVARERLRRCGGVLVLGSATPPLEARAAADRGAIEHLHLRARATAQPLPQTRIVDMAAEFERGNRRVFSSALVDGIGARLERAEKIVLFVNRRGSASFVLCRACGEVPSCRRCSVSLTVHRAEGLLRCHLCDAQQPLPASCPKCASPAIRAFGIGTQRVAEVAQTLFPRAEIVRMDGDTTTRIGDHARLLDHFAERGDILVGTQMVAKGLDFPTVTLVGVVAADVGLHLPDFRAAERTFDLLTQVAGRSGRTQPGEAIIQTYSPAHPAIVHAALHDYDGFAAYELEQRRALRYPPFCRLAYVGVIGKQRAIVVAKAHEYAQSLRTIADVEVLGPAPYPTPRVNDEWRYRIAIKSNDDTRLRAHLRERLRTEAVAQGQIRLAVTIDP